jgi:predicted ATPase/DNA-binding CsgD family transcriptional regulator
VEGVVWVELARLGDAAQVAGAVLAACGAHEMPGIPALDVLTRHFAGSELLLVLDNCEHLLGASAEVADAALRSGGRVRVLATSREPLGVAGETSWRIPSLSLPIESETDPERLAASDAVQLFVARAHAARADFRLEAANGPHVARICRRLDGIPLAIELAAARVRTLSLERLAAGLDDRFRLLTGGARTAVARQRTLLASVEWSHDLLDEEERTLLRRLAVFAAPFSLEAAEAVAADEDIEALSVLELLARLVDKSLVVHAGDRYRLLETIRSYALARAADAGELELLRDRHLAWFQLRARGWHLDREIASRAVLDEVGGEAPDLIAAAEWCGSRERRLPSELLHALAQHWAGPESIQEARSAGIRLLGALAVGSSEWVEGVAPLARVLWHAGELGWYAPAQAALETQGSELDPVTRAFLETGLSLPRADAGNAEALQTLRQAGEVGREAGNPYLELTAKLELLIALLHTGDVAEARPLLAWAERSTPPSSWPRSLVANADELLALLDCDFSRAKRGAQRELAERTLDSLWLGALVAFLEGDVAALEERLREFEHISDVGVYAGIAACLRGLLACARDDLARAASHFERSRAQAPPASGFALYTAINQAHVVLALGDAAAAEALLSSIQAGMSNRSLHMIRIRAEVLAAYLARRRGDLLEAESRAQSALAVSTRHGGTLLQLQALEVLALLAGDRDELDRAGRLLGAKDAFRERSGLRWREHHSRSAFEALRARLPEAALAEGAALSIAEAAAYAARGRGERGRPDHGWASLTPSELRVVELVAEGLPNAAIAKRLFVSLATVKTHLVHVYGKLGLATRAELAAAATLRRLEGEST